MGYFDIFKDKESQKGYSGTGKKAVKAQANKRRQLREVAGGGSPRKYPKPKRMVKPILKTGTRKPRRKRTLWQKLKGR